MEITAQMVKELREATGAGPMDCKKALEANAGDLKKSIDFLKEKGLAKAAKKLGAGREMKDGVVEVYTHHNSRLGVLVEINCETDFVARNEKFQEFAHNVALHIANLAPQYISREEVPEAVVQAERELQIRRAKEEGKPDNVAEKVADGRLSKFLEEIVLLDQPFIKDDSKKISQLLAETVAAVGESIQIRRFARFALGEGNADETDGA
jgi:elongation factor Ts